MLSSEDDERHLTPRGSAQIERVFGIAKGIEQINPERILTSPLVRARETAEIARSTLGSSCRIEVSELLAPGLTPYEVYGALSRFHSSSSVILVSHQPLVSLLACDLLGHDVKLIMNTGALAKFEMVGPPSQGSASLAWLINPNPSGKQK